MLGREGWNAAVAELFARHADGVANGEDTGVEYADDIAGIRLVHDLTLGCHQLLRL